MAVDPGRGHGQLPVRLTGIVGREHELIELRRLAARNRLLTLTGVGGVGKTSLAIAVASQLAQGRTSGARFCDLSAVTDPVLVTPTMAAALGITEKPNQSIAQSLLEVVKDGDLLLVVDNCEQVLAASAAFVVQVLSSAPRVQVIATSRQPLGVPGEVVWSVSPLSVPSPDVSYSRAIYNSPAVRLFVERAGQALPGFEMDARNAVVIASICRRLDGIPLAIELCAARVRVMPPDEILQRLGDTFELVGVAGRTGPARQGTVEASVEWSYQLLGDTERAAFRRLSVFPGAFDIDAAVAACAGEPISDPVLPVLVDLVEKSLVATAKSEGGRARYRMLETIRAFATERLIEAGELDVVRERHARHFLSVAEAAAPEFELSEQVRWLDRLDADHDNLTAALEWAQRADPGMVARFAAALHGYWLIRGHYTEGRIWLEAGVDVESRPTALRAQLLRGLGYSAWWRGDFELGRRSLEEAVAIQRARGDSLRLGEALGDLGVMLLGTDDFAAAGSIFDEELAIARATGDVNLLGGALHHSGIHDLATGRLSQARDSCIAAIEIFARLGHTNGLAYTNQWLGQALLRDGELREAAAAISEAVRLQSQLGDPAGLGFALDASAELAAAQGRLDRAFVLEGWADLRLSSRGIRAPQAKVTGRDRWLPAALRRSGRRAHALMERGARLSDAQVVAFALSDADRLEEPSGSDQAGILSRRELEVAQLLAVGLTNRQISSKLHLSERTIDAHTEHIRNKLGVRSRAQIAAWVRDNSRERASRNDVGSTT